MLVAITDVREHKRDQRRSGNWILGPHLEVHAAIVGDVRQTVDTAFAQFWDQLPWRPDATSFAGTSASVCSARAVIVRLGFTPGLAGSAAPSVTSNRLYP